MWPDLCLLSNFQPALLYIVPAVIGFLAAHVIWNGDVKPVCPTLCALFCDCSPISSLMAVSLSFIIYFWLIEIGFVQLLEFDESKTGISSEDGGEDVKGSKKE